MEIHPQGNLVWHKTLVINWGSVLLHFLPSSETQEQIVSATESLNGRKKMARRKVENGIFSRPFRFSLSSTICKIGVIFSRFSSEASEKRETRALGKDTLTLARVFRSTTASCFVVPILQGVAFSFARDMENSRWISNILYLVPRRQSSAPNMPRQRRDTVAERRGLSKCLKEHQQNGWFT